jgi:Arc/MetJ family transcription regulator
MNTRTNIVIDEKIMKRAMKATGAKTKREVVDIALRRVVQAEAQLKLLELAGTGGLDPDYDYKKARAGQ